MDIDSFFRDTKLNTYLSWLITISILGVFLESFFEADVLWMLFSALTLALILIPPVSYQNIKVMLPWELLLLAAIPVIVRTFQISILANEVATYLSIAALALIIAVELHVFTEIKFTNSFAIIFTVTSTLALAGIWAIIRYQFDVHLGTEFLTTNEALMREFINVLVAGIGAGVLFDSYFRRRDRQFRKIIKKVISK